MSIDRNIVYGIIAIFLWSTTVALLRSITRKINAIQAGVYTFTIGGIICISVLIYKDLDAVLSQSLLYFSIYRFK